MTLEEILEKLHSPTEHAITLENGELTALLEELKELREENRSWKEEFANLNKIGYDFYKELKEAKRLLKAAVGTFNDSSCNKDCRQCKWNNGGCEMSCRFAWIHTDEALKLIGGN